jgi:hypothetical protein
MPKRVRINPNPPKRVKIAEKPQRVTLSEAAEQTKRVRVEDTPEDRRKHVGNGVWLDEKGCYWKKVDGVWLSCFPSGYLKDQKTETHTCHYGRAFPNKKLTDEERKKLDKAIFDRMEECFPNSSYQRGKIPVVRVHKPLIKGE